LLAARVRRAQLLLGHLAEAAVRDRGGGEPGPLSPHVRRGARASERL